jgi:glycosyltransferase involved in cell wall biosynthesis
MVDLYSETPTDNTLVPLRGWTEIHTASNGHAREGNPPLVSVIVAVHNVAPYLSQCLDSLLGQTLKNIEIIVVNDASTDNSLEIIRDYQSRYPHLIRVIDCESNKGLASVRNIGLRIARGEYVGFTDGDDWADIRMCEVLFQRACKDDSDVLIADANVFYEQSKTFGPFFDQRIRQALNSQLRATPFELSTNCRILLLEPVAWTKLYKRSFLQKHRLRFEDGMNSYEDICFHFSVLLKATRISLLDNALSFYRQNRAGQISGRTSRKIFEVFAVFDKIRKDLSAWDVSAEIWALFVKVQVRQFDWLLRDRVQPRHKREFLATVTAQFRLIPEIGFRHVGRYAHPVELAKLFCMRRNWFRAYEQIAGIRWPLRSLYVLLYGYQLAVPKCQGYLEWLPNRLRQMAQGEQPVVKVCRVDDQTLVLSQARDHETEASDAIRRMAKDYYLMRTAVFREGDIVVDVGAHIGVVSIYLAKKYPFIEVYAIEPDPVTCNHLKRNIELNGVTNVTVINKAVSRDGETLEDLFRDHEIRHCRVLKISAPGAVQETLNGFAKRGSVDLLCGEVNVEECSRANLEVASWRIARQHFWRIICRGAEGTGSWLHQMPAEIEPPAAEP